MRNRDREREWGICWFIVPPRNTEALAQAILRLTEDDKLRGEMSQNARRDVESCTWQDCAEEMEAVYKEIATSAPSLSGEHPEVGAG